MENMDLKIFEKHEFINLWQTVSKLLPNLINSFSNVEPLQAFFIRPFDTHLLLVLLPPSKKYFWMFHRNGSNPKPQILSPFYFCSAIFAFNTLLHFFSSFPSPFPPLILTGVFAQTLNWTRSGLSEIETISL